MPRKPSHALVAVGALGIGTVQLIRAKGSISRRVFGRMRIVPMVCAAVSGLFIHEIGLFGTYSANHALSLVAGALANRSRKIRAHQITMAILFLAAQFAAGLFTLYPSRRIHEV